MTDPALAQLEERVAKGIEWLTANDPAGAFHHWFVAGITPLSPMPAQTDETRAAYKEYHRQRLRWEQMFRDLERIEARERAKGASP